MVFKWWFIFIVLVILYSPMHGLGVENDHLTAQKVSYEIIFSGNKALGEKILRKAAKDELAAFDEHGRRRSDIDDAAFQMELTYRKSGYAFATVDYRIKKAEDKLLVSFMVTEGPKVILEKVDITGNEAVPAQTLLTFFEGRHKGFFSRGKLIFVKSDIQSSLSQIRDYYISKGYLNVAVDDLHISYSDDRTRAHVRLRIKEGIRFIVHGIDFKGQILADAEEPLKNLRQKLVGTPYFTRKKLTLQSRLIEIYGNLGYPKTMVKIKEEQGPTPGNLVLVAEITKGPLVVILDVSIQGNEKTRETFIRNRLLLQPGDRYELEQKRKSFRQLYKTGLFTKVDLDIKDPKGNDNWVLFVEVEEAPSKELYFEPGWGSYERLRLKAGFREKNLFGTGRIFGLDATASLKTRGLVAGLSDPWFLGSNIKADLPISYNHRKEPSFTREDLGASLQFFKKLTDPLHATLRYSLRKTQLSNLSAEESADEISDDYNFGSIEIQTTHDTRNDLFFPSRGQRGFISAEYADTILGSEISLMRFTGEFRFFTQPFPDTILGLRYRTGLIIPGPDDYRLPVGERFFNGGENTVRSFKQSELGPQNESGDPSGGLAFNVFNLELRRRLVGNLVGTLFFDCGNVSPNRTRSELGKPSYGSRSEILTDTLNEYFKGFRYGVGFGLQYLLPVGPARVDLAFNPDRDSKRDEDSLVFHLSVGMAF